MRNELRIAMKGMGVGGDEMDEEEAAEVEQDDVEAEEGGLGGGCCHYKPQGS